MDDPTFEVDLIEDLTSEYRKEIKLEAQCGTELESEDCKLDEVVNSTIEWASRPSSLDSESSGLTPQSIESSPSL